MAFRNLLIESPAQISVRCGQLVIRTDAERSIPLEDVNAVLLENNRSTVTSAALSQLGQAGCAVYFCDEKHMLVITEKQYESIDILLGRLTQADDPFQSQQLSTF